MVFGMVALNPTILLAFMHTSFTSEHTNYACCLIMVWDFYSILGNDARNDGTGVWLWVFVMNVGLLFIYLM